MKRRKFILGTGTAAAGGAALLGSGAFSSVQAERSVSVDVAGDADAFLRLAPCTGDGEDPLPNGDYVHGHRDGTISIDLSSNNPETENDLGDGVNPEALTVIHNVFEICNQGTQDVCVDFEVDVPGIPDDADVPDRYEFSTGDPAVVFYRGDDREKLVSTEGPDPDRPGAISLDISNGECECIGVEIRTFGRSAGEDLFEDTDLTILAEAGADCEDGVADPDPGAPGPSPASLVGYWPFDDADVEDGDATDDSGNEHDGTVEGPMPATGVDGISDSAAEFDGEGDRIEIDGFPDLEDIENGITISAWINPDEIDKPQRRIFADDKDQTGYALSLGDPGDGNLRFYSRGKDDTTLDTQGAPIEKNEWYHVAGVYDVDPNGDNTRRIFVDGDEKGTTENDTDDWEAGTGAASIGNEVEDSSEFSENRGFDGVIDEVRVYDRALDDEEIETLANQFDP